VAGLPVPLMLQAAQEVDRSAIPSGNPAHAALNCC
jgi:hypothetical protein